MEVRTYVRRPYGRGGGDSRTTLPESRGHEHALARLSVGGQPHVQNLLGRADEAEGGASRSFSLSLSWGCAGESRYFRIRFPFRRCKRV